MHDDVIWTDMTPKEIRTALAEKDLDVCENVVRDLLSDQGYRRRKALKYLDMGMHENRNEQFINIARIKAEYLASSDPILSIDTKKRELIGSFYRAGRVYTRQPFLAWDHDFPDYAEGTVIPYSLYDVKHNFGCVNMGTSRDTSEFACDSVTWWWEKYGQELYPKTKSVCLLCDGGGSNSSTKYLFREDLQGLSDRLGLEIRVTHYPPYCSQYNRIERRMFCHVTRACQGVLFDSVSTVKRLMEQTHTESGFGVVVGVQDKEYKVGRKYTEGFKENMKILFDDQLPKWNYRAVPGKI